MPDGSCDLTAHVAMDTLDHDDLVDQRTALRASASRGHPADELARATRRPTCGAGRSGAAALTARGGFGDFLWASRSVPPPAVEGARRVRDTGSLSL